MGLIGNYKPKYGKHSLIDYRCHRCGEKVCNGVGPSGLPHITTILNKLPSSHLFFEDACMHDIDYHDQIGKKKADKLFLERMYLSVKKTKYFGRWWWYLQARRNYRFVNLFGDSAYKEGGCKNLPTYSKK